MQSQSLRALELELTTSHKAQFKPILSHTSMASNSWMRSFSSHLRRHLENSGICGPLKIRVRVQ
jgi:hypothetical protein